jgi:hypothetical protein
MSERENDATDAGCEMDEYPYHDLPWGVVAGVLVVVVVVALAVIGAAVVLRVKGGG